MLFQIKYLIHIFIHYTSLKKSSVYILSKEFMSIIIMEIKIFQTMDGAVLIEPIRHF